MEIKKILLLWAPLADYTVACMRQLAGKPDVELYLVYQSLETDAPYDQFDLTFCKRAIAYSKDKEKEIYDFSLSLAPGVIMMSSWNYSFYMSVSKKCRQNGTYVVSAFDNQWLGTLKQKFGIMISSFFLKPTINNFFVPGDRQANFARKLGYNDPLQGYYCANTERFQVKESRVARKFIFVGRLVKIKGIEYLISAYKKYRSSVTDPWGLIICGKGDFYHLCENQEGVEMHGFIQPANLPSKFLEASCLILPSFFEPWGLVVHEAALAGLAIISSFASGASTAFVRDGQNGYVINPEETSLLRAMKLVSTAGPGKLQEMSATSKLLGSLWTTEKWAEYVYENVCISEHRI